MIAMYVSHYSYNEHSYNTLIRILTIININGLANSELVKHNPVKVTFLYCIKRLQQ